MTPTPTPQAEPVPMTFEQWYSDIATHQIFPGMGYIGMDYASLRLLRSATSLAWHSRDPEVANLLMKAQVMENFYQVAINRVEKVDAELKPLRESLRLAEEVVEAADKCDEIFSPNDGVRFRRLHEALKAYKNHKSKGGTWI